MDCTKLRAMVIPYNIENICYMFSDCKKFVFVLETDEMSFKIILQKGNLVSRQVYQLYTTKVVSSTRVTQ